MMKKPRLSLERFGLSDFRTLIPGPNLLTGYEEMLRQSRKAIVARMMKYSA